MTDQYDVIVIGGGAAGLTASIFNGEGGRKVALIERERLGGDCTWTGCVPSKALLKVAKVAHSIRTAERYGIQGAGAPVVDLAVVRAHIRRIIDEIYAHETPEAVAARGVEVVLGEARFIDAHTIAVGGRQMRAKKFVIATGGRAAIPPVPGLADVPYRTNHTIFDNERLPRHLLVLGAGPIGMELGQAYARLGAQVTIIGEQIMPRDEPEAVAVLKRVFAAEGIRLIEHTVTAAAMRGDEIALTLSDGRVVCGDLLLVAAGRAPNIEALDLERAGVVYSAQGIPVNARTQTNIPHIYAIGDVTTGPKFTHYAGFQGMAAGRNTLLPVATATGHDALVPWVTFTAPEVAHAGLTEAAARQQYGDAVKVYTMPLTLGDRTMAEDDTEGFVKLVYRGSGDLLGATVVCDRAGEMIMEYELVIRKKLSLRAVTGLMHPYPTYMDVAKKALSQLSLHELLTSRTGRILKQVLKRLP